MSSGDVLDKTVTEHMIKAGRNDDPHAVTALTCVTMTYVAKQSGGHGQDFITKSHEQQQHDLALGVTEGYDAELPDWEVTSMGQCGRARWSLARE